MIIAYEIDSVNICCYNVYIVNSEKRDRLNKQVLIVCESHYRGLTLRIARAIANELRCAIVDTEQARQMDICNYDVVGFGSGIFFAQHEPKLLAFVESLEKPVNRQKAFIFSTRGNPMPNRYHNKLKELLKAKGWLLAGEFSCRGFDCTGPYNLSNGGNKGRPNETDARKAKKFVRRILQHYVWHDPYDMVTAPQKVTKGRPNTYAVAMGGEKIKLVGDTATVSHTLCVGCGQCTKECPCGVYQVQDGKSVPASEVMCIQCRICQERCPHQAIAIHSTFTSALKAALQKR